MNTWTANLFATAIEALSKKTVGGGSSLGTVIKSILKYPIKTVAAFIMAPFLALRVACVAKNPIRRTIAAVGLVLAVVAAWLAGTLLGTATGALLLMSHFGPIVGLAFFVGTTLSVILSVAFSILIFNATALLFLGMSTEEVLEYLRSISD